MKTCISLVCVFSMINKCLALDFLCNFEDHDCGLINTNADAKWVRKYDNIGERRGFFLVVDAVESNNNVATVKTPYFSSNEVARGCLSVDYYINGVGAYELRIDGEDFYRFNIKSVSESYIYWRSAQIDIDLSFQDIKFYFIAKTNNIGRGTIAIDNIGFKRRACSVP
ncbi:uncharacterized protein LOC111086372 [Limulus polyphemus]|uniref:Uncharacterized protein LOC111086372 n=1 Tax=Limulus polyphemus TaxID=6850 RepID=A0ABM1SM00_LIMPO|nr:uncharacterized protein LOC111086372 [Limulus polyphemus]